MTGTSDLHQLSGAFALDALDELEHARFAQHLGGCESCRIEVESFHATLARVAETAEVTPSAALRAAVLDEVEHTRQISPLGTPHRAAPRLQRILSVAAGVLVLAVLGLSVVTVQLSQRLDEATVVAGPLQEILHAPDAVTLAEATTADGGTVRVLAAPSTGDAVLVTDGLARVADDETYQVWLIEGDTPVPAGLLETDDGGAADVVLAAAGEGVAAVALSVEPAGGSTAPTTDPVAVLEL